ncbi:zinc knuckle CX2CX4HX4C containing protein [Tanacetum coccineum]
MDDEHKSFEEEFTRIPVWVKLHDVPQQVFSDDDIILIATQIGKPVMLDSFTSSMCIDSWGRSSFSSCLIEINAVETAWQPIKLKVRFEPKVHGYSPRNGALNVSTFAKDGSNSVHTSSKKQLAKAVDIPQFDPESYTRSGGDAQDDMESMEEVEVVFDETTNLLSSTITGASTYMAHVVSKN